MQSYSLLRSLLFCCSVQFFFRFLYYSCAKLSPSSDSKNVNCYPKKYLIFIARLFDRACTYNSTNKTPSACKFSEMFLPRKIIQPCERIFLVVFFNPEWWQVYFCRKTMNNKNTPFDKNNQRSNLLSHISYKSPTKYKWLSHFNALSATIMINWYSWNNWKMGWAMQREMLKGRGV